MVAVKPGWRVGDRKGDILASGDDSGDSRTRGVLVEGKGERARGAGDNHGGGFGKFMRPVVVWRGMGLDPLPGDRGGGEFGRCVAGSGSYNPFGL